MMVHLRSNKPTNEGSASVPDQGVARNITVRMTNNDECRKYDKKQMCFYCEKPQSKLARHLRSVHNDMDAVCDWMAESDAHLKDAKLTKLRNLGNHVHNCNVLKEGHGELIVKYRPTVEVDVKDFVPCSSCYAYFAKRFLWKHKCPLESDGKGDEKKPRGNRLRAGTLLLPGPSNADSDVDEILGRLRGDAVSRCIKSDDLIIQLAKKEYMKLGHDPEQQGYIRTKLREIARLLIEVRVISGEPNGKLSDFIHPAKYQDVVSAARTVAGFDYNNHLYKVPSLALKLGHTIKKCALILKGNALQSGDDVAVKNSSNFYELCELKWTEDVATHAHRTLSEMHRNNPKRLPLTEDIMCLTSYLRKVGEEEQAKLSSGTQDVPSAWKTLNEITLTQVMLFNRRRQGEVSKMTVKDYETKSLAQNTDILAGALTTFEKELMKMFKRVEIVGKRGNIVPVLLTAKMEGSIDLLLSKRKEVDVSDTNKFLFPYGFHNSDGHIRGSDCIRKFAVLSGAKNPTYLRSTNLRKHIATVSQVLNLRDNELDILAKFMGHDVRVHREYYRLPESTVQVAKITKLLLSLEEGTTSNLAGKTLDEIDMNEDDGTLFIFEVAHK